MKTIKKSLNKVQRMGLLADELQEMIPNYNECAEFMENNENVMDALINVLQELHRQQPSSKYELTYNKENDARLVLKVETPGIFLFGESMKNLFAASESFNNDATANGTVVMTFVFENAVKTVIVR